MNLDSASSASSGPPPNPRSSRGAIAAQQVDFSFKSIVVFLRYISNPLPPFTFLFPKVALLVAPKFLRRLESLTISLFSEPVKRAVQESKNVTSNDRSVACANG